MKNAKKNNIKIGTFSSREGGLLEGMIYGLGLGAVPATFDPLISKDGKAYYRLIADADRAGYEIGAAFPKKKDGLEYHYVTIDSPMLPAPINAALFKEKETGNFNLVWSRQDEGKDLRAEATVNVNVQPQQTQTSKSGHLQQLDL